MYCVEIHAFDPFYVEDYAERTVKWCIQIELLVPSMFYLILRYADCIHFNHAFSMIKMYCVEIHAFLHLRTKRIKRMNFFNKWMHVLALYQLSYQALCWRSSPILSISLFWGVSQKE